MLIWLFKLVFGVADFILGVVLWALPIYFICKMAMPENKYVLLAGKYIDMALVPVRKWFGQALSRLPVSGFDLSPVALWVLVLIARVLLRLLQGILL